MNNIDIYYESIKQVFEQITNWKAPKPPLRERVVDVVLVFAIGLFVLSVIPIVPILYVLIGSYLDWSLFSIHLSSANVGDFGKIWLGAALGTLPFAILMNWVNDKVDSASELIKPPHSLSPEQLTFISVYKSYKELKIFFVSHIEQHIDNSLSALGRVLPYRKYVYDVGLSMEEREMMLRDGFVISSFPERDSTKATLSDQVLIASSFLNTFEKYAWFELDTRTKSILQALISFSEKIPLRLKDKQDLPRVLSVLENLSKFTYAYLPEHHTYMDTVTLDELHSEGEKCLDKFSQEVNELTSYSAKESSKDRKHDVAPTVVEKVRGKFYENVFLRFSVWFVLILILTSGAVGLINQKLTLTPDTIVTIIIGTSVASAAALAGFLPSKPK